MIGPTPQCYTYQARRHWPIGSEEDDFYRVFTIYGRGGHLGHVNQTPRTNFRSPIPLALIDQVVLEKKIFESGGRRKDDYGRTDD